MPTHGVNILVEDDDTNTTFQFEKYVKKMTRGVLKHLDDNNKTYQLNGKRTTIGRDLSCDICINNSMLELNHAVIDYVEKADCFVIEDFNTPHGTYVNDCRVQNAVVRLSHGDVLRLGHGGPRFEVALHVQSYPPVVHQHAWNSSNNTPKNLPYIPLQPSLEDSLNNSANASKILSTIKYGRQNGYHAHNKTEENAQQHLRPHPPQRTRPVSANPANNAMFVQSNNNSKPLILQNDYSPSFSSWYQQQNKKLSDQILDLEGQLLKMGDEMSRLSSYESECSRKDMVIEGLRNQVNDYQKDNAASMRQTTQIQSLQNQIVSKDNELKKLREDYKRKVSEKNDNPNRYTNQMAQMKTTLTRNEQVVAILENDLQKLRQNKQQLTGLINTLQKEGTSKDMLIKKWKSEYEKAKIELKHKDVQLNDLERQFAKQDVTAELEKQIHKKEEEISRLLNKNRRSEEIIREKDSILDTIKDASRNLKSDRENLEKKHEYSMARINELEKNEQSTKTETHYWKQKFDRMLEKFRSMLTSEDSIHLSDTTNEDQMFDTLNYLKSEKNNYKNQLENVSKERAHLERQVSYIQNNSILDDDVKSFQAQFAEMKKRLSVNGRSCKNLANEMNSLDSYNPCDQLLWLKDLVMSLLSHEYNWESDIESALTNLKEDDSFSSNDPSYLIRKLHEKLQENMSKITDLEIKIHTSEDNHARQQYDTKEKIKEKYKQKTEKAIKETRFEEYDKYKKEVEKNNKENEKKLKAMQEHNEILLRKEESNKKSLNKKIDTLKKENKLLKDENMNFREDLHSYRGNEQILKEQLDEKDKRSRIREEILEQRVKEENETELSIEKAKNKSLSCKIIDLENNIIDVNKIKKELEYKIICMEQDFKDQQYDVRKSQKDIEVKSSLYKDEITELKDTNLILREDLSKSQQECNDLKEVIKSLKKDINGMSARITDLKGEMSDKDKETLENLSQIIKEKDIKLLDQRNQLLELSSLVEQQKDKLIEQDQKILMQHNNLAIQSDEKNSTPKVSPIDLSESLAKYNLDDSMDGLTNGPVSLSPESIAERCIAKRHEQIIKKQKLALAEMRNIISSLEHLKPPIPSHELALVEISNLKKEVNQLKLQVLQQEEKVYANNDEMYDEVCRSRNMLKSANHDIKVENQSHRETLDALHLSEDLYLKLLRSASEALEIHHVLGCSPIGYTAINERNVIAKEREKAMDVILSRIKTLRTRLERKDKLLESYDSDLRSLRETERLAGKKSAQAKDLESQVTSYKDEISYLQEALRKCRNELDDQRRFNTALKEKKVFMMDYQENERKGHNCNVDEQQKYKDEKKLKKKDEQLKKQKYEIQALKQELIQADMELTNANSKLARLGDTQDDRVNDADMIWSHVTGRRNELEERPVRDTDPVGS